MKINKLNNKFFCDFASKILGIDVCLYKEDMQIIRTEKSVKMKIYLGGESEDERSFFFKDDKCVFIDYSIKAQSNDLSFDWVSYVLENVDELTNEEKMEIMNQYNANIEEEIENYASQTRESLIV